MLAKANNVTQRLALALLLTIAGPASGAGVIVFGDSTESAVVGGICYTCFTQGNWTLQPAGYLPQAPSPPPTYLSAVFSTVDNQAVGGATTTTTINGQGQGPLTSDGYFPQLPTPAVTPYATLIANSSATTVKIGHGVNDARGHSIASFKANLRTMADIAIAAGKTVIFDTPQKTVVVYPGWTGDLPGFVQAMKEVAAEYGAVVIDTWDYTQPLDLAVYAPTEGVHYTQEGMTIRGTYAARFLLGRNATPTLTPARIVTIIH